MVKRSFDVVAGTVLLVATLPVVVFAAVGSAIAFRAWPLFVQDRVGRGGTLFRFVKIRTLPTSTPAYSPKYALESVQISSFARLIRRLHIDELPQLALVIAGKMSLVGPRPEMPQLHAGLDQRFAESRTRAVPGCTGLWQIGHHCTALIGEAPQYDTFYLRHMSLRLDLWILGQTLRKIFQHGKTVSLGDVPAWARQVQPAAELKDVSARRESVIHEFDLQTATD